MRKQWLVHIGSLINDQSITIIIGYENFISIYGLGLGYNNNNPKIVNIINNNNNHIM